MVADNEINRGFFFCLLSPRKVLQAQASIQTVSEFSFNETHYLCFCSTPCSLLFISVHVGSRTVFKSLTDLIPGQHTKHSSRELLMSTAKLCGGREGHTGLSSALRPPARTTHASRGGPLISLCKRLLTHQLCEVHCLLVASALAKSDFLRGNANHPALRASLFSLFMY